MRRAQLPTADKTLREERHRKKYRCGEASQQQWLPGSSVGRMATRCGGHVSAELGASAEMVPTRCSDGGLGPRPPGDGASLDPGPSLSSTWRVSKQQVQGRGRRGWPGQQQTGLRARVSCSAQPGPAALGKLPGGPACVRTTPGGGGTASPASRPRRTDPGSPPPGAMSGLPTGLCCPGSLLVLGPRRSPLAPG